MTGPRHDFVRSGEWRCGCGAINAEEDSRCHSCARDQDGVLQDGSEVDTSDIPEAGEDWFASATFHSAPKSPYGEWCRDPELCKGKGYCPRDPNCGD